MAMPFTRTILMLGIAALSSAAARAQFDGKFSLSKAIYPAGEPVFLSFKLTNTSGQKLMVHSASPLTFCSGYDFKLIGAMDRYAPHCNGGQGGSCASGAVTLAPGQSHIDRILLNQRYDLRKPGHYKLHAAYDATYVSDGKSLASLVTDGLHQTIKADLEIVLVPAQNLELREEFAPYVEELASPDWERRQEAAKVIAYLAPTFLEPEIIKMLDSRDLQGYGVEGLRNLGTPSAHQVLAEVVKNSPPSLIENSAIGYLGEIGDKSDIATLLNAAHANAEESSNRETALLAVGEAGGDDAVPVLLAELNDPDIDARQAAIRGLYSTGSRLAVPVLIALLRSPQWRESSTAEYGLEVLTHRRGVEANTMDPLPQETYGKWSVWWAANGHNATMYTLNDCGEILPLP